MSEEFVVANTEYGKVRGKKVVSEISIPYFQFLGIPYAEPPVNEKRFTKATKPKPWNDVFDALTEPPPCAGRNNYLKKVIGTDDCLYLNIYTKDINPKKPYPVIAYIIGGGFNTGSINLSVYSPDYLLMHDVTIVIFNYRLGPLGFLSLKDKTLKVPGNAGLKDQQLALEFIRDNISNFGGDPNNVTLMGHSSGGISVNLHLLAEKSRGLFKRAVIMAGSLFFNFPQLDWPQRLAKGLNFEGNLEDEKEILKFLESADCIKMAEVGLGLMSPEEQKALGGFYPFGPSIEPYQTDSTFISEPLINLLRKATWSNDVDVLIGGVENEGLFIPVLKKADEFEFINEIPVDIFGHLDDAKKKEIAKKIEEFYVGEFSTTERVWDRFFNDTFTWIGMCRFIKHRLLSKQTGKTFLYKFAVDSPTQNHYRNRQIGVGSKGVTHADELSYIWKNTQGDVPPKDSMEFRTIEKFTGIIASFASFGRPNIAEWLPVEEDSAKNLTILPDELKIGVIEDKERIFEFWGRIFEEAGVDFC